jgi:NADH pyrophosphatase NudC (nudix superfamily)
MSNHELKSGIVVVIKQNAKYLLIKQNKNPYKGFWAPVHGVVEMGETEEEAVIRETIEEVNLEVKPIKKLYTSSADYKVDVLHWWLAEYKSGNIKIDLKEASEYGFFSLQELATLQLLPMTKNFFAHFYGLSF